MSAAAGFAAATDVVLVRSAMRSIVPDERTVGAYASHASIACDPIRLFASFATTAEICVAVRRPVACIVGSKLGPSHSLSLNKRVRCGTLTRRS
jgi:hypothetical protein